MCEYCENIPLPKSALDCPYCGSPIPAADDSWTPEIIARGYEDRAEYLEAAIAAGHYPAVGPFAPARLRGDEAKNAEFCRKEAMEIRLGNDVGSVPGD